MKEIRELLKLAQKAPNAHLLGKILWDGLYISGIEYIVPLIYEKGAENAPYWKVTISGADPECYLSTWLYGKLEIRYPNVRFECRW